MPPRILVIGLDAATLDLIEPWAAEDRLPALGRLMREGVCSRLLSTPNMHSASAWTSILTGLNPGRHGLFVFSDRDFETNRQMFFKGGDRKGELISSHLARAGITSGLLNVPMTYPAECRAGGFTISGLDAPSLNEAAFCPVSLRDEVFSRFPEYRFTPDRLGQLMRSGSISEAVDDWLRLTEVQASVAEYLLAARPVDFFMTVFTASDWGGHNLWRYLEDSTSDLHHSLLTIYQRLDNAIDRLLQHADSRTAVFVISDHGMGRHSGASYRLGAWLESNGFLARIDRSRSHSGALSLLESMKRAAGRVLPDSIKEGIRSTVGAERMSRLQAAEKDSYYASIDWGRTIAYTEPGRHIININLKERNPEGMVAPKDYDATCEEIIARLLDWTDSGGRRVVERVSRRADVYRGPFLDRASDLHVYWNPNAEMGEPPEEVRRRGFWWSGDHRPDGILIARGAGIRSGAILDSPSVYDFTPTILYLAGLPVPEGLEGRVLEELFEERFAKDHPPRAESAIPGTAANREDGLTPDEEALIEEKLRNLGYL